MRIENMKAFKKDYDRIYKKNKVSANLLLLMAELADEDGHVMFDADEKEMEKELIVLMGSRFKDASEYQFNDDGNLKPAQFHVSYETIIQH